MLYKYIYMCIHIYRYTYIWETVRDVDMLGNSDMPKYCLKIYIYNCDSMRFSWKITIN